jgi:hypothetical protein
MSPKEGLFGPDAIVMVETASAPHLALVSDFEKKCCSRVNLEMLAMSFYMMLANALARCVVLCPKGP